MAIYYADPSVSSGGSGTLASPWSLRRALSSGPGPGDTLYLRGGTYYGGFTAAISGLSGNPVKIKPYPGEQYVIEQYVSGTLTSAINASTTTLSITFANGSATDLTNGDDIVIDGNVGLGTAESCHILSSSGNPFTVIRARDGTGTVNGVTGYAHSAGALVYASVNAVNVTGNYQQWWGCDPNVEPWKLSTIKCSNPIRSFNPSLAAGTDSPPWQRCRAAFTASNVAGLQIIGLIIRDSNDGIFITGAGGGHVMADLLAYNNGHVDATRGHGQPMYIHTETGATAKDIVSFSNFGSGWKFYGVNGAVINCVGRRIFSFNNMAPASYVGNPGGFASNKYLEGNAFIGSENDQMSDCAIYDSVFWAPYDSIMTFPMFKIGHGQDCHNFIIDNNWIIGGDQIMTITLQKSLTFTRNTIVLSTGSSQSSDCVTSDADTGDLAAWTWGTSGNINTFYNKGYLGSDPEPYNLQFYLNGVARTNEFGSGHLAYDRPATTSDWLGHTGLTFDYHASTLPTGTGGYSFNTAPSDNIDARTVVAIVKWDGTATGTFSLPSSVFTAAGFASGEDYRIHNALNYDGDTPITGTYSGSAVSIASGSFTHAKPEGFTTQDYRGNTWSLGFGTLIIYNTGTGGGGPGPGPGPGNSPSSARCYVSL